MAGHASDAGTARRALRHEDPGVRASALIALERSGVLGDDELDAALVDPDPRVRRSACELASTHHGHDDALVATLGDVDPLVAEAAAFALGELEALGALDALCEAVRSHDDARVKEAALGALGNIGDPRALRTVLDALGDKATVRRRAVVALAAFEGPEVDAALEAALVDRDWQVREVAEILTAEEY